MTNKNYILSKLGEVRRNAFVIEFEIGLLTHRLALSGNAKIDTGCENTSIALQSPSIGIDQRTAMDYKRQAIEADLNMSLGFGANDTNVFRKEQTKLFRRGFYMDCSVLKFDVPVAQFCINGYDIPIRHIGVSYDRTSNVLIGMDILKHFEYHCGASLVEDDANDILTGDHIFIGCLKTHITTEYLNAVEMYLGYADIVRNKV